MCAHGLLDPAPCITARCRAWAWAQCVRAQRFSSSSSSCSECSSLEGLCPGQIRVRRDSDRRGPSRAPSARPGPDTPLPCQPYTARARASLPRPPRLRRRRTFVRHPGLMLRGMSAVYRGSGSRECACEARGLSHQSRSHVTLQPVT